MAEVIYDTALTGAEDWSEFSDFRNSDDVGNCNEGFLCNNSDNNDNSFSNNFTDAFSLSLEDLANSFDQKITKCFCNYEDEIGKFAPVQVRTQEELMSECQIWWTLTGNFCNILPVNWSKSYAQKLQLSCLNLNKNTVCIEPNNELDLSDDELAKDLDLHSLIISSLHQEPIFTAEQVIEEIDKIMLQEPSPTEISCSDDTFSKIPCEDAGQGNPLSVLLYEEKLNTLSTFQLNEIYLEVERMIKDNSEVLIQELALRDELEFEKELKNTFISVLLSIQNKKRQSNMEKKRGRSSFASNSHETKFLTTVIPYSIEDGPPNIQNLQILIKILKAINEDNPVVPGLLTDYILKVLCPT